MSTHTPGPWMVIGSIPEEDVDCFWIKAQPSGGVCRGFTQEIGCVYGMQTNTEQTANARLISAAPDLLETLRFIVSSAMSMNGKDSASTKCLRDAIKNAANHAIAKATGQ